MDTAALTRECSLLELFRTVANKGVPSFDLVYLVFAMPGASQVTRTDVFGTADQTEVLFDLDHSGSVWQLMFECPAGWPITETMPPFVRWDEIDRYFDGASVHGLRVRLVEGATVESEGFVSVSGEKVVVELDRDKNLVAITIQP